MLNIEELNKSYFYNHVTGIITRKLDSGRWKKGQVCGWEIGQGYTEISLNGKTIGAHRLAWALHYQEQPPEYVDHINRIKNDNRIVNLRAATKSQNGANRTILSNNTNGFKGCYFIKSCNKWRVQCRLNKKLYNLGYHSEIESARKAYNEFASKVFGEYYSPAQLVQ